jgi:hypothetical protein
MFQHKFALAAASVLILSGCAASEWRRIADHPADPTAAAGVTHPVISLERYRASAAQPPGALEPQVSPSEDAHPHHHHGEDAQ